MSLQGKVAIVTGGAKGIGKAIANGLKAEGANIVIADADEQAATATAKELGSTYFRCDITDPAEVKALAAFTRKDHGEVDILVNNAGIGGLKPFFEITLEDWTRMLNVNITGMFIMSQTIGRHMAKAGSGRIINIASVSGVRAGFARVAYGTSKAAIIHFTRQLAVELGPFGINANAIGPGPVDTEPARANHSPQMREDYHTTIPLGRYGDAEEMADAVNFLAGPRSTYINGQTLFVDGGFTAGGVAIREAQEHSRKNI